LVSQISSPDVVVLAIDITFSLLLLEYEPAVEAAAVGALFGNLQNKFVLWHSPPDQPGPGACSAVVQDFDGLAVNSARRLRPGAFAVAESPLRAIQVKDAAGADGPAVHLDPIQREYLAPGMRLDPNRETPGLSVSGKGGSGRIQLPAPRRLSETAGCEYHRN
jgi:hypothetical protein